MPVLRELVARTRESAAFHVRQGNERVCLHRVDSPQVVRDHIRVGDVLPLNRGSGGRVLMAFAGARGAVYERIRQDGVVVMNGDRVPELTGVSAPVFGADGTLRWRLVLGTDFDGGSTVKVLRDDADNAYVQANLNTPIFAKQPPERIGKTGHMECLYCDFHKICQEKTHKAATNCRTCVFAEPHPDGTWFCRRHTETLSKEKQTQGCNLWEELDG
jgi:hypothetical protein